MVASKAIQFGDASSSSKRVPSLLQRTKLLFYGIYAWLCHTLFHVCAVYTLPAQHAEARHGNECNISSVDKANSRYVAKQMCA